MLSDKKINYITLSNLKKNQPAIIASVNTTLKISKRLADMGLTPGTKIEVLRKIHPYGPIELKVRGSNLILGKEVLSKILVNELN